MKILQLGKFYPIRGGVEKVMYDLMLGLCRRGVECDMMCAETDGYGQVRTPDIGARVYSFHTWSKVASTTLAPSMINRLRAVAGDYDLIHIHHPDPMAAIALRLSGYDGPLVLHWHSDIIKSKPLLKLYEPLQEWLLERADAVLATSPSYIGHSPALSRYSGKTSCIPIGVAPLEADAEGARKVRSRYGKRKIIFSLGRLVPYKGYQHLIRAASLLPDDYVVLIGGEGPLFNDLVDLRDSMALHNKVHFLRRIPQEDLTAYYTACDIFCLPSVMKTEAFGIVQIEAMSLGKPVVATKIPGSGTAWVNESGVSGLNVEPADAAALAQAIQAIGGDPQTYARLCEGARRRFDSHFTLESMVSSCHDLYSSLISNQSHNY